MEEDILSKILSLIFEDIAAFNKKGHSMTAFDYPQIILLVFQEQ